METIEHDMNQLFAQLGLADDEASVERLVADHRPMPDGMALAEAPFWNPAQAAFLREEVDEDADWAPVIDALNLRLHT